MAKMKARLMQLTEKYGMKIRSADEKKKEGLYFALRREITEQWVRALSKDIDRSNDEDWAKIKEIANEQFYDAFGEYNSETKEISYSLSTAEMMAYAEEIWGVEDIDEVLTIDAEKQAEIERRMMMKKITPIRRNLS